MNDVNDSGVNNNGTGENSNAAVVDREVDSMRERTFQQVQSGMEQGMPTLLMEGGQIVLWGMRFVKDKPSDDEVIERNDDTRVVVHTDGPRTEEDTSAQASNNIDELTCTEITNISPEQHTHVLTWPQEHQKRKAHHESTIERSNFCVVHGLVSPKDATDFACK